MGKRVALLSEGRNSDLYAGFCAVKLARRTEARLYSLLIMPEHTGPREGVAMGERWNEFSPSAFLQLVGGLCELEKVNGSYHLIERSPEENLVEFIVAQKISCLIVGTVNDEDHDRKRDWLSGIVNRVCSHSKWYFGELTVFFARPWSDERFQKVLRQINRDCTLYPVEMASS